MGSASILGVVKNTPAGLTSLVLVLYVVAGTRVKPLLISQQLEKSPKGERGCATIRGRMEDTQVRPHNLYLTRTRT